MEQGKAKILISLFLIFFIQLYCLSVVVSGPIIGITLAQSQDQSWYIQQIEEESWAASQNIVPYTKVLELDGMKLTANTSSPFLITQAHSITIWHEGKVEKLIVSNKNINAQLIKQLIMPLLYTLITTALCLFLFKQILTKNKQYLIFHLQFTALAYISAGAAGRGDFISNVINSLAIFLSIVNCIFYCNYFLRTMSDAFQKKLRNAFFVIGIMIVVINIARIFIEDLLKVQIIFELSVYLILSCLLAINIIVAAKSNTKYYAKPLFCIFFLGIGPFALCYGIPTIFNVHPFLPADVTALFLLVVPICLIYLEMAGNFVNLQYALDRMFSHLQLAIPFSLVLSFILLSLEEVRSFYIYSLYFLITFISSILLLSYKESMEVRNARYLSTLKNYNFSNFYRFIKSSAHYATNFDKLMEYIKQELNLMLMLNDIEIIEDQLTQSLGYIEEHKCRAICPNLIYKHDTKYILVLYETVDSKLLAITDTKFRKIPSESLKMLELFLYYVQSIIDNSLKLDELMAQLTKLDKLHAPRWYNRLWILSSEKERLRLSTEIHDTILQDLIHMSRNMEEAATKEKDDQEAFMHLREEVLDIVDNTREICENLYPPLIDRLGLHRSLEELIQKCKIRFNFLIKVDIQRIEGLSLQQSTTIYRIIQELLSNANKHSQAQSVHISLTSKAQKVFIDYWDDGIGIDIDENIQQDCMKSIGLMGMKERIKYYQGTFLISSNQPQGTNIKLSMKIGEDFENNGIG